VGRVLYSLLVEIRFLLSAIASQQFPPRSHFYICGYQDFASALGKKNINRSATKSSYLG
jgi:hypothetical protein